jgi:uncharacterized protein YbjT (DUF2867 family)
VTVLVVGSTGMVGGEVCRQLGEAGERVRALARSTSAPDRVAALSAGGAEIVIGDLKDPSSLARACQGVDAVVSTASATVSRQPGDSIESVDAQGQLNLVEAARAAGVRRFVFVSFRQKPSLDFPLDAAKRAVESAIADLNFTNIQASWFMEVWLGPHLGFDYANATARIYGSGTAPVSWVSYRDVATMCRIALKDSGAERKTIEFGGPEALSPLEVIARFEAIGGRKFQVEHVPEEALRAQHEQAQDSLSKTFAGLMLAYSQGDPIDMRPLIETFGLELTSVDDYARAVLGSAASA